MSHNTAEKCIYSGFAYPYLNYGVTSWGNAASKYINKTQVQQNYLVKIITHASFYKAKLLPLYQELCINS